MPLNWFSTAEVDKFAKDLAATLLAEREGALRKHEAKFIRVAARSLDAAERRVQEFKARERLNVYKKAKLANTFLWALKDAGCPDEYANELTDWLTKRL